MQGHFKGYLKHKNTETEQDTFVIRRLGKPLLGHPPIEVLAIVTLVEPVTLTPSCCILSNFVSTFDRRGMAISLGVVKACGWQSFL